MKNTETIYEILKTPVENLRQDQVDFLNKVVKTSEQHKKRPIYLTGATTLTVAIILSMFGYAFLPNLIASLFYFTCGIGLIGCTFLFNHILTKLPNYKEIGTNKFSFEEFILEGGIEQVKDKLQEYDNHLEQFIIEEFNLMEFTPQEKEVYADLHKSINSEDKTEKTQPSNKEDKYQEIDRDDFGL